MIRVLVVDDHPIVRAGIAGLLTAEPGFEVLAEAANGVEALETVRGLAADGLDLPDVVLMDLRMPELDGVAATEQLRAEFPALRVLVLTTYESDDQILAAIEAGASGYLLKAAPAEEIFAGVRGVAEGKTVLAPALTAALAKRVADEARGAKAREATAQDAELVRLTPRELEVLECVARGLSNPAIARELFIGEATVKTHLLHIFEKLEVQGRTRAVTRAHELGLLDLGA